MINSGILFMNRLAGQAGQFRLMVSALRHLMTFTNHFLLVYYIAIILTLGTLCNQGGFCAQTSTYFYQTLLL